MSIRYHILCSGIYGDGRLTLFDDSGTPADKVSGLENMTKEFRDYVAFAFDFKKTGKNLVINFI